MGLAYTDGQMALLIEGNGKIDLRNGRGTLLGINSDKEIYGIWRNDTLVKVLSKEQSVKN